MDNEKQKKPVSPQKLAANRANAQHSTGPQSEAGKEKSAQNSYQHGFFARRLFPTSRERDRDGAEYDNLVKGIRNHFQPIGFMEDFCAERIAVEMLRSARLLGYEQENLSNYSHAFERRSIDSILRFHAAINRQLAQAIEELERLQAKRRTKSKQDLPDAEVHNPVNEDEMEEQLENEDQLQIGPDVAPSGDCGTNPTISGEANDPVGISSPIDENCGTDPTPS
jgi:hypothetical protein